MDSGFTYSQPTGKIYYQNTGYGQIIAAVENPVFDSLTAVCLKSTEYAIFFNRLVFISHSNGIDFISI